LTGDQFRAARCALGLTQDDLGRVLGVGGRTVRKWERGERRPSPIVVHVLRWIERPGRPSDWPDPPEA